MKRTSHSKIWKSGFLIILFLFPVFAKPVHLSYEKVICSSSNSSASRHHSGDCPVCLFHYFAFTEAETPELSPALIPLSIEPFFHHEKIDQPFLFAYFLRGPPVSSYRFQS
jgi:hypothetical protein